MHKIITEELKSADSFVEFVKSKNDVITKFDEIISQYEKGKFIFTFIKYSEGFHEFHIDLYQSNSGEVLEVLKKMAKIGLHIKGKPEDFESLKAKMWRMGKGIRFFCRYTDGVVGPNCRYVKVGEKMEPVFELKCDEVGA